MGRPLHQSPVVDALDSGCNLDGRNEPMENGAELGTFDCRHLTEIQQMPPSFHDDRSCAGRLQRGMIDEEVIAFDDVAAWEGCPGVLTPYSGSPASGRYCSRTGDMRFRPHRSMTVPLRG
jgi:hypothetical protein